MRFDEYQKQAGTTAIYPNKGANLTYPALGLAGEVGELCNQIKKIDRDDHGTLTDERLAKLHDELGDVLWYCAALASEMGIGLSEVAANNLCKLAERKQRGRLAGSGDKR